MREAPAYGMNLPLALGEEFTELSLRFEVLRQVDLFRETIFQVKHLLQILIAYCPCIVHLALCGFFLWKDDTNKCDRTVKAFFSLFLTRQTLELRLNNPVNGKYSRAPIPLDQPKFGKPAKRRLERASGRRPMTGNYQCSPGHQDSRTI